MKPQHWKEKGTYVDYNGIQLFYVDQYTGVDNSPENLLLIHGFPTSGYDWWKLADELSSRFRIVIPDMTGFGFTDKPKSYRYT
ncbi:MAG: alpha/beta fold hydrolase, partial [Cyclobacteriaceae bacterium]